MIELHRIINRILNHIPAPKLREEFKRKVFIKNANKSVPIRSVFGDLFYLNPNDLIGVSPYLFWERQFDVSSVFWALKTFSLPCNSFLDLGANIGWYTISIGKSMRAKGPIIAVEPDPINYHYLMKNITANALKVHVEKVAVSSEEGVHEFYLRKENMGGHSLFQYDNDSYSGSKIIVKTTTINKLIEKYHPPEPILVKMDIEGYEYFALKSSDLLLNRKCVIITEFVPEFVKRMGKNPKEILEYLNSLRFKIYNLNTDQTIDPDKFDLLCSGHATNLLILKTI